MFFVSLMMFILCPILILVIIEVAFRVCYRLKCGRPYSMKRKYLWNDNYIVSHPFLTFFINQVLIFILLTKNLITI